MSKTKKELLKRIEELEKINDQQSKIIDELVMRDCHNGNHSIDNYFTDTTGTYGYCKKCNSKIYSNWTYYHPYNPLSGTLVSNGSVVVSSGNAFTTTDDSVPSSYTIDPNFFNNSPNVKLGG